MADMFGAPVGLDQADTANRRDELAFFNMRKTMGEIEQQPVDLALKKSHGRYYDSLAAEHEAKAAQDRLMLQISQEIPAARAEGVDLTVKDADTISRRSLSDPLTDFIQRAQGRISPSVLAPFITKAAQVQAAEARALSSQTEAADRQAAATLKQATRVGQLAAMAKSGPEAFAQAKMMAAEEGINMRLPDVWGGPAMQALDNLITQSTTVKDKIRLDQQERAIKAQESRTKAANTASFAAAEASKASADLRKTRRDFLIKNDGDASETSQAAKRESIAANRTRRLALDAKNFPPMPLSQSAVDLDTNYTTRSGIKVRAVADPNGDITNAKGTKMRLVPITLPDDDEDE